jgi:hypothetical protein
VNKSLTVIYVARQPNVAGVVIRNVYLGGPKGLSAQKIGNLNLNLEYLLILVLIPGFLKTPNSALLSSSQDLLRTMLQKPKASSLPNWPMKR